MSTSGPAARPSQCAGLATSIPFSKHVDAGHPRRARTAWSDSQQAFLLANMSTISCVRMCWSAVSSQQAFLLANMSTWRAALISAAILFCSQQAFLLANMSTSVFGELRWGKVALATSIPFSKHVDQRPHRVIAMTTTARNKHSF